MSMSTHNNDGGGSIRSGSGLTYTCSLHLHRGEKGRLQLRDGKAPRPAPPVAGRVPRIARLMALSIRFDGLIRDGNVRDYAELARVGHVTRARVTQIMNLLMLAPDIQEFILFLPEVTAGHDPIQEWQLRPIAAKAVWSRQRKAWKQVVNQAGHGSVAAGEPNAAAGIARAER